MVGLQHHYPYYTTTTTTLNQAPGLPCWIMDAPHPRFSPSNAPTASSAAAAIAAAATTTIACLQAPKIKHVTEDTKANPRPFVPHSSKGYYTCRRICGKPCTCPIFNTILCSMVLLITRLPLQKCSHTNCKCLVATNAGAVPKEWNTTRY